MNPLQKQQARLNKLVEKFDGHKFVVIFEGRDTAGKSGTIRELEHYLPTNSFCTVPSKKPSKTMMKNWFSEWSKKLNNRKPLTFFDRSYYSRALCQPVNNWCTEKQYRNFLCEVLDFEKNQDCNFIKFWCSISQAEQKERLKLREVSPLKYWKLSPNDKKALSTYDRMTLKKEAMFNLAHDWHSINFENKQKGQLSLLIKLNNLIEANL